jgi:hypothetical protein
MANGIRAFFLISVLEGKRRQTALEQRPNGCRAGVSCRNIDATNRAQGRN